MIGAIPYFCTFLLSTSKEISPTRIEWQCYGAPSIFFLHLDGVSIITKRNWVMATIATCFLMMRKEVILPHRLTSEPCEHVFGHLRSMIREFSANEFITLIKKLARRFQMMFRGKFQPSRDTKKVYQSTAEMAVLYITLYMPWNAWLWTRETKALWRICRSTKVWTKEYLRRMRTRTRKRLTKLPRREIRSLKGGLY